jgi:phosphogluconate dehydratase
LGVLQDRGFKVALVTDGRMSGASGKVPAAIHVTPEAAAAGPIAKLRDGDLVRVDGVTGTLTALVDETEWESRQPAQEDLSHYETGIGRDLFAAFRAAVSTADTGASIFAKAAA